MSSFRRIVLAVLTAFIAVAFSLPAAALAHVYDGSTVARFDVRASGRADSRSAQFTDMREGSATPHVVAGGTSST